jgi:hypothetical protein
MAPKERSPKIGKAAPPKSVLLVAMIMLAFCAKLLMVSIVVVISKGTIFTGAVRTNAGEETGT